MVLSGTLELRTDDGLRVEARAGDVVGEPAFMLATRRIADVYAGPQGACVLSLDETRLQRLVHRPNRLAALLLLNLSKALARKLATLRRPALSRAA